MKQIGQPVVPSDIAQELQTALDIADRIGYPVIVRPAFTLGGSGGGIANTREMHFSTRICPIGDISRPVAAIAVSYTHLTSDAAGVR